MKPTHGKSEERELPVVPEDDGALSAADLETVTGGIYNDPGEGGEIR